MRMSEIRLKLCGRDRTFNLKDGHSLLRCEFECTEILVDGESEKGGNTVRDRSEEEWKREEKKFPIASGRT